MKQNNDISRHLLILYCIAFVICCTFTALHCHEAGKLTGYWEGEFMPEQGFKLILAFYPGENKDYSGNVFLFQGAAMLQNDPLTEIELAQNKLSFRIEAKNTTFTGVIDNKNMNINGLFRFPDGMVQPVFVNKVTKPSSGSFSPDPKTGLLNKDIGKKYPVRELRADFSFLCEQVKSIHPGLYDYISKDEFARVMDSTAHLLQGDMTEDEFYRFVAPLVSRVNCCHTTLELSDGFEKAVRKKQLFVPFKLMYLQGKAYLVQKLSGQPGMEKGVEILSINGLPAPEIKKRMMAGIPADGYNTNFKEYFIDNDFALCYSQYIGFSEKYAVEYKSRDNQKKRAVLDGIAYENTGEPGHNNQSGQEMPFQFQIIDSLNAGILTLKSFMAPDWQGLLETFNNVYEQIKREKLQNLILDLRGNSGGHPFIASQLLGYLLDKDFVYFALPEERGEFAPLYEPLSPHKNRFGGNLYVLINGGCLSTTGHFLSLLKYHNRGIFIGRESGGTFSCNDGTVHITLPHTGIRAGIARITFVTAVQGFDKGYGIFPDYIINATPEQKIQNKDPEKQFVIELIKKNNK